MLIYTGHCKTKSSISYDYLDETPQNKMLHNCNNKSTKKNLFLTAHSDNSALESYEVALFSVH